MLHQTLIALVISAMVSPDQSDNCLTVSLGRCVREIATFNARANNVIPNTNRKPRGCNGRFLESIRIQIPSTNPTYSCQLARWVELLACKTVHQPIAAIPAHPSVPRIASVNVAASVLTASVSRPILFPRPLGPAALHKRRDAFVRVGGLH